MDKDSLLLAQFEQWQLFQFQAQLNQEHQAALEKLAASGVMANRVVEAYRNMAHQGERQACYRTLYRRQNKTLTPLSCEAWIKITNVNASGGMTLVTAQLITTFDLFSEQTTTQNLQPPQTIMLEIFDCISLQKNYNLTCQVDRQDKNGETHFISYLDQVRNYQELLQNSLTTMAYS